MLKNCLIKCPWCQGTGRKDYEGNYTPCSTNIIPDDNLCPKCSGRLDKNTTFGGGWLNIDNIVLRDEKCNQNAEAK